MGYQQAIRDRIPRHWVFCLKHLRMLDAYVRLVYGTRIRPITNCGDNYSKAQIAAMKRTALHELFPNSQHPNRTFYDTLDEQRMSEGAYKRWLKVNDWICWFCDNYLFMEAMITTFPKSLDYVDRVRRLAKVYCNDDDKLAAEIMDYYTKSKTNERV